MTIEEFKDKVKNVDNLVFKEYQNTKGQFLCYFWQTRGDNKDVKNYIKMQLNKNLTLILST